MLNEIQCVQQDALLLHSQTDVEAAIECMANAINERLADSNPLLLCVINGGIIVTGQLLTKLNFPLTLDSIHATRYRGATSGSEIHWLFTPTTPLKGRTVLIVDDILDEGFTLQAIVAWCQEQGAEAVHCAVLIEKDLGHDKPIHADFVGLTTPNHYLFGYGMDYKDYLRNAAGIYACKDSV